MLSKSCPFFLESFSNVNNHFIVILLTIPLFDGPFENLDVKVLTTQMIVTFDSFDFVLLVEQLKNGYIQGTTTEIVDHKGLLLAFAGMIATVS